MTRLDIRLLGPPTLTMNGAPAIVDTRKALALAAYLAMTGQKHTRAALAAFFWPEFNDQHSRAALRRTLSALKGALGGYGLEISRSTLALDQSADIFIDAVAFQRLISEATRHQHGAGLVCSACLARREEAVALYQDDFLAGFSLRDSVTFDDWQLQQSESLRLELARALEQLVLARQQLGAFEAAIGYARRWLQLDPLREAAHRRLMRLYAWTGQRSEALRQFRECIRTLEAELGVPPLEETTALYRAIKEDGLPAPLRLKISDEGVIGRAAIVVSRATTTSAATPGVALLAGDSLDALNALPLIGRESELAVLEQRFAQTSGDGFLMVVAGETGVGKTRLVDSFSAAALSARASGRLVKGRCYESEAHLAYGCFGHALRDALNLPDIVQRLSDVPPHWLAEASRLMPELLSLLPDIPQPPAMSGPGAQSRFMEGIVHLITALCGQAGPGILLLDDVHWADEASLDLLTYLAHRLLRRPLFVLLTWRDDAVPRAHRLRQLLAEAERGGIGASLQLPRLNPKQVAALVAIVRQDAPDELGQRLFSESEGLPYFLVEYLAVLAQNERRQDWQMPRGVQDLLHARLGPVGETARQLLQAAAVVGRVFDYELLLAAGGRSEEETISALEDLVSQGLVSELEDGGWAEKGLFPSAALPGGAPVYDFRHHQMRLLVYNEMVLARRRILHRRVAEELAQQARLSQQSAALAGQIAQHFQLAGQEVEAAHYSKEAGDFARTLYANREALSHYQTALALGHPEKALLHEACGDLYTRLGDYSEALASYESAMAVAADEISGRLEHRQGLVQQRRGAWKLAEAHFQAAHAGLPVTRADAERARVLVDWSRNAYGSGELERAISLAAEARRAAELVDDPETIAQTLNVLGMLARRQGDPAGARAHLQQSLEISRYVDAPAVRIAALNNLALVCIAEGNFEEGLALLEPALALCREQGDRHQEAALQNNLADLLYAAGRQEESMAHLKRSVTIYAEIGKERGEWQPEIWKLTEW